MMSRFTKARQVIESVTEGRSKNNGRNKAKLLFAIKSKDVSNMMQLEREVLMH